MEELAAARRRIDKLMDDRFLAIEQGQDRLEGKVDALTTRVNLIAGGLAVLSFLLNILGPVIVDRLTK